MRNLLKTLAALACAAVLACAVAGCQAGGEQVSSDSNVGEQNRNPYQFEEYNVVTFEIGETEESYGSYITEIKATNNSDIPLKEVSMDVTYRDKDKNVLFTTYPQFNSGVLPGTYFLEKAYASTEDVDMSQVAEITIDTYSYYIGQPDENGNNYFVVNSIAKSIDAYH